MVNSFLQKIGFWPKDLLKLWNEKSDWIWFHAVSVGEFNAIFPLIEIISKERPHHPIMVSCTTKTGYKLACEKTRNKKIVVFYFPFDIPTVISSLLSKVNVKLFIIAETEIWPIVLSGCKRKNIPIILVNARISDKSFKNYLFFKFYFKKIVNLFTEVLAQSKSDAEKFIKLGLVKEKLRITNNLKFSTLSKEKDKTLTDFETTNNSTIKMIFASTHKGEEEIALNTYKNLLKYYPQIRLIIAPRHPERTQKITTLIKKEGFNALKRSLGEKISSEKDIFLLDTIGELSEFYKKANITVMGGTFVNIGGHNILEPIRANSYTIIGPYDHKIRDLTSTFKENNAITQAKSPTELIATIREALENKDLINIRIGNGRKIVQENENTVKQVAQYLLKYL